MLNYIMMKDFFKNYEETKLIVIWTCNNEHNIQTKTIKSVEINKYFITIEMELMMKNQKLYIDIDKIESVKMVS